MSLPYATIVNRCPSWQKTRLARAFVRCGSGSQRSGSGRRVRGSRWTVLALSAREFRIPERWAFCRFSLLAAAEPIAAAAYSW